MTSTKDTNLFQDAWAGWVGFVREITGSDTTKRELKRTPKSRTMVPLKRDVKKLRRPQPQAPKRTKLEIKAEKTKLTRDHNEVVVTELVDPPQPYLIDPKHLETPEERKLRIEKKNLILRKTVLKLLKPDAITKLRRRLLFVNPGTEKVKGLHQAFLNGTNLPKWALPFKNHLEFDENWVYFDGKAVGWDDDKRDAVKKLYFDPKEPSTILPITDKLREDWANISKRNVTNILRSFEVYQLNFGRRHPPKVLSRMSMLKPGMILADMFFPSKTLGWRKIGGVLTMMDAWSRYLQCYAVERKTAKLVKQGMERFLREFASLGHMPRIIICDKGTDLAPAKVVMEKYRRKPGPLVYHSKTGKPVQLVESTQAQIQRRMQVFRTAGLTDDPSEILEDICSSINTQKRPDRGNLTPMELLKLNKQEITHINELYRDRTHIPEVKGLRTLYVGSNVRVLLMTFKEQVQNKTKGFAPKWSRDIFTIRKKTALQGNPDNFRYFLEGEKESYFRHELLWVPRNTDTAIVDGYVVHQEKMIVEDPLSDYSEEYPSDDSRY